MSLKYLIKKVKIGETCTLNQEENNLKDKYGRLLGTLYLVNGNTYDELINDNGENINQSYIENILNNMYKLLRTRDINNIPIIDKAVIKDFSNIKNKITTNINC